MTNEMMGQAVQLWLMAVIALLMWASIADDG